MRRGAGLQDQTWLARASRSICIWQTAIRRHEALEAPDIVYLNELSPWYSVKLHFQLAVRICNYQKILAQARGRIET